MPGCIYDRPKAKWLDLHDLSRLGLAPRGYPTHEKVQKGCYKTASKCIKLVMVKTAENR